MLTHFRRILLATSTAKLLIHLGRALMDFLHHHPLDTFIMLKQLILVLIPIRLHIVQLVMSGVMKPIPQGLDLTHHHHTQPAISRV